MDDNRIDKAAAFDTLFTNNRIQILKTLAYYIDPHLLKGLAVYIKFLELQYTLALFRKHPETALHSFPLSSDGSSLAGELCSDLMPMKRRKHPCSRSPRCLTISIIFKK